MGTFNLEKSLRKIILLSVFTVNISCFQLFAGKIVYPWRAVKSIVKDGDSFHILYNNFNWAPIDSLILEGPYNRVVLQIDSVSEGRFEFDTYTHSSVNNKIWAHVPKGTPEELYTLILKSGGETLLSVKSVNVIKEFKAKHSFIHITDLHMSRNWIGLPKNGYAEELRLFDRFIDVANVIAPDFVIVTGDLIHDYTRLNADSTGWGGIYMRDANQMPTIEEKWRNCYEGSKGFSGLNGLNSPVFAVAGNHDFYGLNITDHLSKSNQWNNLCGLRVYGFSYAGTRILAMDDFLGDSIIDIPDKSPMSGLQGKVLDSFLKQNGPGLIRILGQHRSDRVDTNFIDRNKINILLHGHTHSPYQQYIGKTPTLYTRPGVVCRSGVTEIEKELGFFRIFTIDGDKFSSTPPLRFCKDPTKSHSELELNLTLDFKRPNDGSSINNEAIIHNSFPVELQNCKIRFVMKKGSYKVSNGIIRQVIQTAKFSVVDVNVDVSSNDSRSVMISKR